MNKRELIEKYEKKYSGVCVSFATAVLLTEIQNDLKQLDEPQKPVVPKFVADWIEYAKFEDYHLLGAMDSIAISGRKNLDEWFRGDDDNMDIFARAWLDGYEVEKEKRYRVKMKGMDKDFTILKVDKIKDSWYLGDETEYSYTKSAHTRKEFEDAGFGAVFNSPLFEVEEVTK